MNIKKTIGILSMIALGTGLLGCGRDVGWGQLLYKGMNGNKEVKYWKSSFSHLKETSRMTALHSPSYLKPDDYEYKPAYLMEIKMPNGDAYIIKDINMDERITPEGDDKVTYTPKDDRSYGYDNSSHLGKLMLEEADKLYQNTLAEIKEDLRNRVTD